MRDRALVAVPYDDLRGFDDGLIDEISTVNWRDPFATIRAQAQRAATPLQRLADADDVAAAVPAAADHLTFTTGSVIGVDDCRPLGVL